MKPENLILLAIVGAGIWWMTQQQKTPTILAAKEYEAMRQARLEQLRNLQTAQTGG